MDQATNTNESRILIRYLFSTGLPEQEHAEDQQCADQADDDAGQDLQLIVSETAVDTRLR